MTTATKLCALFDALETGKRDDRSEFVSLKSGSPEWMRDLCHAAHGDMMPDDFVYSLIPAIVESIANHLEQNDDLEDYEMHECADGLVDVYTHDLTAWLGSRADRYCWIDEAKEEGLLADDADEIQRLMIGQYHEISAVIGRILQHLDETA
jgi:hypothetical protein